MKQFILGGLVTLLLALIIAAGVFFYIQGQLSPLPGVEDSSPQSTDSPVGSDEPVNDAPAQTEPPLSQTITEPIPLRSLPLSDTQRSLFETAGVDVDTYEITPAAIGCAEEKIGADRVRAIMEGDSPSFTEGIALSSCL